MLQEEVEILLYIKTKYLIFFPGIYFPPFGTQLLKKYI